MAWTAEQERAISERGKNIIVSAAAGSGKTAVLVERIKRLIIEDGVSIDRLLVVTFTNAAASEMKQKILKAINDARRKHPEKAAFLRRQTDIAYRAHISTFHSFAMSVIRDNFQLTDADANFSVCDEAMSSLLREEAMDEIFSDFFEEGRSDFLAMMDAYSTPKNFRDVRDMTAELYDSMMNMPEAESWLNEQTELVSDRERIRERSETALKGVAAERLKRALIRYEGAAEILREAEGLERLYAIFNAAVESLAEMAEGAASGAWSPEDIGRALSAFETPVLRAKASEKESYAVIKEEFSALRDEGKKLIKELRSDFFSEDTETLCGEICATYPALRALSDMALAFGKKYAEKKRERKLLDFADIEQYALKILENDEVCREYRKNFDYVFVDEYQDTNFIQDRIVERVSRENNKFLVGDLKQCIYRFRQAEPSIFKEHFEEYAADGERSCAINLNHNFRSKGKILEAANEICLPLLENYAENRLNKGISYEGELEYPAELYIIETGAKGPEEEAENGAGAGGAGAAEAAVESAVDAELSELKASELEARLVCGLIKKELGREIAEVGAEGASPRRATYRDMAVLMRGVRSSAEIYGKAFFEAGIPFFIDESESYFDTIEIELFMNLLRVVDNRDQDIALLSLLRSPYFGFTVEELAKIRIANRDCSYFEAFLRCAGAEGSESAGEAGSGAEARGKAPEGSETAGAQKTAAAEPDDHAMPLYKKCAAALKKIDEWQELAKSMRLDDFCARLMDERGFLLYVTALPGGEQRRANLTALVGRAKSFVEENGGGLSAFIAYADALRERRVKIPQTRLANENDNAVHIMTIHKSKGLEFPIVFLSGLGKKINTSVKNSALYVHSREGIALRSSDAKSRTYKKTLAQKLIRETMFREQMEEEARILYVALTRAKDRLILSATLRDFEKEKGRLKNSCRDILGCKTELELCAHAFLNAGRPEVLRYELTDRSGLGLEEKKDFETRRERLERLLSGARKIDESDAVYRELERRFSFEYEKEEGAELKAKYSVTELNDSGEHDGAARIAVGFERKERFTAAERGSVMHTALEHIDFAEAKAGAEYAEKYVKSLVERELLTAEEAETIECEKLSAFISSDIGKRLAGAKNIFREEPFSLLTRHEGREVFVQGIIDCFFTEEGADGGCVLLDYKTNARGRDESVEAFRERMRKTYERQIELYAEAIETLRGLKVGEAYLYLTDMGETLKMR